MSLKNRFEKWLRNTVAQQFTRVGEFEQEKFVSSVAQLVADEADQRNMDPASRHNLIYRIQRAVLPQFVIADHGRVILDDGNFREIFTRFSDENWTSFERKWNLKELLKLTHRLSGDFAECGVFRGGSAYLMCQVAQLDHKQVHLFDSFAGLSKPAEHESEHWSPGDLAVGEEEVHTNLREFDNFHTYAGWIPERFADVSSHTFSFVHIDVDLEQPTRDSIEFFYPRLVPGGVLLLDDHGSAMCPGARATALDYFANQPEQVMDLATGQGLVIKQAHTDN